MNSLAAAVNLTPSLWQQLRLLFWRTLVLLRIIFPLTPASNATYVRVAGEHLFDKLHPDDVGAFTEAVEQYLRQTILPRTGMSIYEALRNFDYRDDHSPIMLDPEDQSIVRRVQRHRMVEVIFRKEGVFIGLFEAIGGNLPKLHYHHSVYSRRDGCNRRLRFLFNRFGEMRRTDRTDENIIFDPRDPISAYAPKFDTDHPLVSWLPKN